MGWYYDALCLRFLSDIAPQKPGLQAGLLLWQRSGDSLTRGGCAMAPSPQPGQGPHRPHSWPGGRTGDTLLLVTSFLNFFLHKVLSFSSTVSYAFCSSSEAFTPEVASLRFSHGLSDTCKLLGMGLPHSAYASGRNKRQSFLTWL